MRLEFYENEVKKININRFLFIDETGSTINETRRYGRSKRGEKVFYPNQIGRSKRVNTIAALTTEGIKASFAFEGTLNAYLFYNYVKIFLLPELTPESVVILDNATAHDDDEALELIETTGAKILFLPPYSPELNPIEMYWAKFKAYLKKEEARTIKSLYEKISIFIGSTGKENMTNYIKHCGYDYCT